MARVIVADDDEKIRAMVRLILRHDGHDVVTANDGASALKAARESGADLLVSDVFMPDVDGLELIRRIRQEMPDIKIISMSGGGFGGTMDMLTVARHLGASVTLHKPFTASALLAAVEQALAPPSASL